MDTWGRGSKTLIYNPFCCDCLEKDSLKLAYSSCSEAVCSLLWDQSISLIVDNFKFNPVRALKIYIDYLYLLSGAEFHDHWPKLPSKSLCCSSALQRHFMSSDLSSDWHITGLLRKRLNYRRDLSTYAQVQTHNCPGLLWAPVLESCQQQQTFSLTLWESCFWVWKLFF